MRPVTAILIGWLIVLTADLCFGQSYNAAHAFRSRTLARPSSFARQDFTYSYAPAYRPAFHYQRPGYYHYNRSLFTPLSEPSFYSSWIRYSSQSRTSAALYGPAGLDASRSLYRPALGSPYYDSSTFYSTGSDAYNQSLSERRASSVSSYLTARGIIEQRLMTVGMGEKYPVADNGTADGRQANRRVEITMVPLTSG